MDISNQIKTRREAMGLSQEQLAEKLYVSRQTISNWERDKTYLDVQSLLMLSILFDTSIDTLVKGDVTVMEEAVERDRKRMGTRMLRLAVAFALILSPAFNWMEGTWGAGVAAAAAFLPAIAALVVATVLERIKRPGDIPRDPRCPQCRQVLYSHKRDSFNNKMQCPRAPSSRRWSCRS